MPPPAPPLEGRGQAEVVLAEVVDAPVLRVGGGEFGRRKTSVVEPDPKLRTTRSLAAGIGGGGRHRPPPKEYYEQVS